MSLLIRRGANRWRPVGGARMWRPLAWSNVLRVVGRHRHPPAGAISGSPRGYPEGKGAWARTFDQPSPMTVGESRQQDTGVPSGERACPRARCGPVAKSRHGGRSVERHFSDYPARHSLSARHPFGCFRRRFETGGRGRKEMMTRSQTARGNEESCTCHPRPFSHSAVMAGFIPAIHGWLLPAKGSRGCPGRVRA